MSQGASVPIYQRTLSALTRLGPLARRVEQCDRELASQLRRAASSMLLNLAEGMGSSRGTRRVRFESALGSARETLAALHVAEAWGYLERDGDHATIDEIDHLVAILVRFVRAQH